MNLKVVTEQTKKENNNTEILPQKNQNKKWEEMNHVFVVQVKNLNTVTVLYNFKLIK